MNRSALPLVYQDMMSLSMTPMLRLAQVLECRVCRQCLYDDTPSPLDFDVAFFGAAPYVVCACCHQIVEDSHDKNYRARFRRYVKRLERVTDAVRPTPRPKTRPCLDCEGTGVLCNYHGTNGPCDCMNDCVCPGCHGKRVFEVSP
jgi:hypothetical protein